MYTSCFWWKYDILSVYVTLKIRSSSQKPSQFLHLTQCMSIVSFVRIHQLVLRKSADKAHFFILSHMVI